MKTLHRHFNMLAFAAVLTFSANVSGQVTIWSDNFNNGCAADCAASTWNGWTILDNVDGTSGGSPNNWYISCAEEGMAPPNCGSSCVGDASMHIGADSGGGGDMGASFNETGINNATYRMAVSPTINTTGHTGITLNFDFIAYGSASCSDDRLQLRLSTDNGATWPAGYQYCLSSVCCGSCNGYSQGQWTLYALTLPAAFDNNPNVRVGFHWVNNGNGSGTDPSAAIDDIQLTRPVSLSVDLLNFTAEKTNGTSGTHVSWRVENERSFAGYELERSTDGTDFTKIYSTKGNCTGSQPCSYLYKDVSFQKVVYYRLKMIDLDGSFTYSSVISLDETLSNSTDYSLISAFVFDEELQVKISSRRKSSATFTLYNLGGKAVLTEKDIPVTKGFSQKNIDLSKLTNGVYILKVTLENGDKVLSAKVIKNQ